MRRRRIAGMRVAYIQPHTTAVHAASATTGARMGCEVVIGVSSAAAGNAATSPRARAHAPSRMLARKTATLNRLVAAGVPSRRLHQGRWSVGAFPSENADMESLAQDPSIVDARLEDELASLESDMPRMQSRAGNVFVLASRWAE